ncbi:hypothetical protein HYW74_00865 [Candidatus Pacearchaeota archaeon]|nr:hypothetical protein [Candidatus Pacearchaeota archaeon]
MIDNRFKGTIVHMLREKLSEARLQMLFVLSQDYARLGLSYSEIDKHLDLEFKTNRAAKSSDTLSRQLKNLEENESLINFRDKKYEITQKGIIDFNKILETNNIINISHSNIHRFNLPISQSLLATGSVFTTNPKFTSGIDGSLNQALKILVENSSLKNGEEATFIINVKKGAGTEPNAN